MEPNEIRMIALVNLLVDAFYPNPDDPGPVGPWGPWIREALKEGPIPEPWGWHLGTGRDGYWWQEYHPGSPPYWKAALAELTGLAAQVDNHDNPFGGRRPRPNWVINALLHELVSLNPQPLPPVDSGIGFARSLADVALRRVREAGSEQGGSLLLRFSEDWCGTVIRIPFPPKPAGPGEPRPPRPQESLVLGAALVRSSSSIEDAALKKVAEAAGRRIFEHGLSGLA